MEQRDAEFTGAENVLIKQRVVRVRDSYSNHSSKSTEVRRSTASTSLHDLEYFLS